MPDLKIETIYGYGYRLLWDDLKKWNYQHKLILFLRL
jgi:hypothetical protein